MPPRDRRAAFLGPALVKGRSGLRACFMNLRTTEADIDFILERLSNFTSDHKASHVASD